MVASMESISIAISRASDAYTAMVASEGRIAEVDQVLTDLADAKQSVEKFGIAVENMSLINRDQNLTQSLGLEALALEAIETLSEDTKKMLQSQYVTAIEGQVVDMIKTAIARIKDFFVKAIKYVAEEFTTNAKLAKVLDNLQFEGELNAEATISALSYDDAEKCLKILDDMYQGIDKLVKGESIEGDGDAIPDSSSDTVANLGWTKEKAAKILKDVKELLPNVAQFNNAWKVFQAEAKKAEASGNAAAAKEDKGVLEDLKAALAKWLAGRKITGKYIAGYRKLAFTLIAVDRKCKKTSTEEPKA
jgi:hypothetical protein